MSNDEKQKLIRKAHMHLDTIEMNLNFIFETIKRNREKAA